MNKEQIIYLENIKQLVPAIIWHLNNPKGTNMGIPNEVYRVWDKKLAQMPKDRKMTESEALKIVRKQ